MEHGGGEQEPIRFTEVMIGCDSTGPYAEAIVLLLVGEKDDRKQLTNP
jgi:hypothetical protein